MSEPFYRWNTIQPLCFATMSYLVDLRRLVARFVAVFFSSIFLLKSQISFWVSMSAGECRHPC